MDFWISDWISGFHSGFLDFSLDFWISGFQFGFLQTVYEISFVTDPSAPAIQAGPLLVHATDILCRGQWLAVFQRSRSRIMGSRSTVRVAIIMPWRVWLRETNSKWPDPTPD